MNFANLNIRRAINEAGLNQKEIAHRMGITPEYFSRVMSREPLPKHIEKRIYFAISGDCRNAKKQKRECGSWVKGTCDLCGFATAYCEDYSYCPNCGARMKGVEDDGK